VSAATSCCAQVSHAIGGERVAALLPLLMKPGALGKMPKKQRERLKQETGAGVAVSSRIFEMPEDLPLGTTHD